MGQKQKREYTEGATGLGRLTKGQKEKWNQITAVGFKTGGRHQKCPASFQGYWHTVQTAQLTSKNQRRSREKRRKEK